VRPIAPPPAPQALPDPEAFARRHVRHNVLVLGADFGLFFVGLSFASQTTILPAFAEHLGAPNLLIGAIPAVMTAGWHLPSLFTAGHTETLRRKLPFVLRYTLWERVPFLVLAVDAFFLARPAPGLALAVLLVMLLVLSGAGGVLMPAWMDIVGRAVPRSMRGRFFAVANVVANVGGLLGSLGTGYFLAAFGAPASYGLCFLAATLFVMLSYLALALTREPPAAGAAPAVPLWTYLGRVPDLLRRDRNLSWFLLARAFGVIGTMASGFYTVYALRAYAAPPWQVAVFTAAFLAGDTAGSLALGWLADRAGHRLVLIAGVLAAAAANLVALSAPTLEVFTAVFALHGVQVAVIMVSGLNVLLEFAPAVGEQPTYVGLGTTLVAPIASGAPLLAALIVDGLGFRSLFAAAAGGCLVSLGLFLGLVRDPRQRRAAPVSRRPGSGVA
jgi:MFS family permease